MSMTTTHDAAILPNDAQLARTGLTLPSGLTFDQWEAIGATLRTIRDSSLLWWWGDWLNYGETRYGEKYSQAVEGSDYSYSALTKAVWVCKQIDFCRRRQNLSYSHHQEVANLTPDEQDIWLDDATANGWSVHTLRQMIRQTKEQPRAAEPVAYIPPQRDPGALEVDDADTGTLTARPGESAPALFERSMTRGAALYELYKIMDMHRETLYQALRAYATNTDLPPAIEKMMAEVRATD